MINIKIDNNLFSFLQRNAIPFIETPNDTLKRLLKIESNSHIKKDVSTDVPRYHSERQKAPRTNLGELERIGLLEDGQILYMTNYKGEKFAGEEAVIKNGVLYYKNIPSSLSKAAKVILLKNGFDSKSVRGPARWVTEEGISVMDLWNQYLTSRES